MRLLLDTHIFLWFISGDARLSVKLRDAVTDPANEVFVSAVSVWEAMIKSALGKLPLPAEPHVYLPQQRADHGLASLEVDEPAVVRLADLPPLHRDPFDRLLICQAIRHDLDF